jgi:hypothetical protein
VIELFQAVRSLYPNHPLFGPSADPFIFRFCHGDLHDGNIFVDPTTGEISGIIDWESACFRPWWTDSTGVGWLDEDCERHLFEYDEPTLFAKDGPSDHRLRAFFRTELHKRNPDLFSCFLGAVEMRAILHAATLLPMPCGETRGFLSRYYETGCWDETRRGPFPYDALAWEHRRIDLDEETRVCLPPLSDK